MAVFDWNTYNTSSTNTVLTTNTLYNTVRYEPVYRINDPLMYKAVMGADLISASGIQELAPKLETDMAWLKRRVGETCWVPS